MYTNQIPSIEKLRDYHLLGIASMFPQASASRILNWFIVQRIVFNPQTSLRIYDDLIAMKLIHREIMPMRCGCGQMEVYKLTEEGMKAVDLLKN